MKASKNFRRGLLVALPLLVAVFMIWGGGPLVWMLRAYYQSPRSVSFTPLQVGDQQLWLLRRHLGYGGNKSSAGKTWTNYQVIRDEDGALRSHIYFSPGNVFSFHNATDVGQLGDALVFDTGADDLTERLLVIDILTGETRHSSETILESFSAGTPVSITFVERKGLFEIETTDGRKHAVPLAGRSGEPERGAVPGFEFDIDVRELRQNRTLTPESADYTMKGEPDSERRFLARRIDGFRISAESFLWGSIVGVTDERAYVLHSSELGEGARFRFTAYDLAAAEVAWTLEQESVLEEDLAFTDSDWQMSAWLNGTANALYLSSTESFTKVDLQDGRLAWSHAH